jgi:choloylglycine hydrolase
MSRRWAVAILLACIALDAYPCTTFCMTVEGQVVFGANYDWDVRTGRIMVNKRSVTRESLTQRPAQWVSRYASITFNQYGRDFPTGGMNEAGLVVALMDLADTEYPAVDNRPSAGVLDWIQYQLDLSADIDQAVANASAMRIATGSRGLHYLIADRTGRAVTIEHLGGALVTHSGATLPVSVLANNRYDQSVGYLSNMIGFGGSQQLPSGTDSLQRFARAATMIRQTGPGADPVARAFAILDAVRQPNTRWSIVYNPTTGTVSYRTDQDRTVRWVDFSSFDLGCASPVKLVDMNAPLSGDLAPHFTDYTTAANIALINQSYDETPSFQSTSEETRLMRAMHPEKDVCGSRVRGRAVGH